MVQDHKYLALSSAALPDVANDTFADIGHFEAPTPERWYVALPDEPQPFFHQIVGELVNQMGDAYPELRQAQARVTDHQHPGVQEAPLVRVVLDFLVWVITSHQHLIFF